MPKRKEPILKRLGRKGLIFDNQLDRFVYDPTRIDDFLDSGQWKMTLQPRKKIKLSELF